MKTFKSKILLLPTNACVYSIFKVCNKEEKGRFQ